MPALERGFTLPEVMLAMTFGSLIALAAAKTYPLLRQQSVSVGQHYRLESVLRQLAFGIEKDLRRTGFCAGQCQGRALFIDRAEGEATGSCVIIAYDLNRNGRWENSGADAEYFGYRLRQGALEGQRGVSQCRGNHWERLLDQEEVQIDTFSLSVQPENAGRQAIILALNGHSTSGEGIQRSLSWVINMEAP
jgi:prepilin peptidase dependent protein B